MTAKYKNSVDKYTNMAIYTNTAKYTDRDVNNLYILTNTDDFQEP